MMSDDVVRERLTLLRRQVREDCWRSRGRDAAESLFDGTIVPISPVDFSSDFGLSPDFSGEVHGYRPTVAEARACLEGFRSKLSEIVDDDL
jgi:hypothetical protein